MGTACRSDESGYPDPAWTVTAPDDRPEASVNAALFAVTDGCLGTRAVSEAAGTDDGAASVRVAGIYGPEPPGALVAAPTWTPTALPVGGLRWSLDLATGRIDHQLETADGPRTTNRWAVAGEPGCQAYILPWDRPVPSCDPLLLTGSDGRRASLVAVDRVSDRNRLRVACVVERSTGGGDPVAAARQRAECLAALGIETLRRRQYTTWAARWADCSVVIDGDPGDDVRTRFALYHLQTLSDHGPELPLGARGLTGAAYAGHVFWDTDVFVLPALVSVAPTAARAVVAYRLRRLAAARRFAAESGTTGARLPWESAASGADVTPRWGVGLDGRRVPIRTGQQERHITADVVWALATYRRWTGDHDILQEGGAELMAEAARHLAATIEVDDGVGHLRGVVGPDEYHETVDDNAFTNQMTAWALRSAAGLTAADHADIDALASPAERAAWCRAADSLVDGYDVELGRHHQFAGYDRLDPVLVESIAEPPFAADVLLGRDMVRSSQIIKQADVVMLHHLLPDEMPTGSTERDLAYYLPRTAHGSSLSPAIHAAVLARAGRPNDALRQYRLALAVDLDDLTGTSAGGLHYATIGGVWQALIGGFLGIRPTDRGLCLDPVLPSAWDGVEARCRYRNAPLRITATHDRTELQLGEPSVVLIGPRRQPTPPITDLVLVRTPDGWRPA